MKPPPIRRKPVHTENPAPQLGEDELRHLLLGLIDSGRLRSTALFQAGKVVTRLGSPARVVLVGSADAIKSALVEQILGEPIVPLPPEALLITGAAPAAASSARSAFARPIKALTKAAPILAKLSLLLVPASSRREARRADLIWAADHCDICVWDCFGFDSTEAALWSEAPEALRANAFLVAPQLCAPPPGFLARFDPQTDLGRLAAALTDRAALARQARRDQAALFLARYGALGKAERPALPVRNWQEAPRGPAQIPAKTKDE